MTARRHPGRARPLSRALVALVATVAVAGPAGVQPVAATPTRPSTSAVAPAAAPPAVVAPADQAPPDPAADPAADLAAGAYEPGFVDVPLPTNPPSPALADVEAESDELDRVEGQLVAAEGRRDDAVAHRDDLRQQLVDLGEQRADAVTALGRREADELRRGEERVAATAEHGRRAEAAAAAAERLEESRAEMRDMVVAAYVNESSSRTDSLTVLGSGGDVGEPLMRLEYTDRAAQARLGDVRQRVQDREAAVAAEERAAAARAAAEQAEDDAVAAREAAEQRIVDLDAETVDTRAAEVEAVATVADREAGVLTAAEDIAPARVRADVVGEGIDFPLVALDAWVKAAAGSPCPIEWWALAGISKIEGRHGTHGGGRLGARGYPSVKIIGPQLDGTGPFAAIGDTDGGLYDGDPVWDRAVGPMQFIPSTWARWGRDGDGDGRTDPFTVYDATAAAAAYLCAGRTDLRDDAQLRAGYFSYNHSQAYVETVMRAARAYQQALPGLPLHVPVDPLTGDPVTLPA